MTLDHLALLGLFHFFLVFARLGTVVMLFPGIGEIYVSPRTRLALALMLCFVLLPVLSPSLPPLPDSRIGLFFALLPEVLIGLFIGGITRLIQAVLHMAGMIIAFQSSLASALLFDANQGSQGSVVGNFLTIAGLALIFASGMHHEMLRAVVSSYQVFPAAQFPLMGDMSKTMAQLLAEGFLLAFRMSAPLIVIGLCLYLAAGLMGRLMPNMQVFFIMIPVQIYVGFLLLALAFSSSMLLYLEFFRETLFLFR